MKNFRKKKPNLVDNPMFFFPHHRTYVFFTSFKEAMNLLSRIQTRVFNVYPISRYGILSISAI